MSNMASHGVSRAAGKAIRTDEVRQQQLRDIDAYKELVDVVNTKIAEKQYTLEVLGLVTTLLKQNPEYYTIWNHRRRVLEALFRRDLTEQSSTQGADELLQDDLQLTFALLRQYPKCYWIWNHRNWLLEAAEAQLGADAGRQLWAGELQLVNKMLGADSRNFHAWGYRRFVTAQIERLAVRSEGMAPMRLTEAEFDYTSSMIKSNLSNFSAWHYRSKIIPRLLEERNADAEARRALLDSELALMFEAINTDPFDQSIWFYHQYLMSTLSPDCPSDDRIVRDLDNGDRERYYANEIAYIREILEDEEDCKWVYEGLLFLADQAQNPNTDDNFDDFAVSACAGICSGCGAGIELDAIGDGPSLDNTDAAATSLFISAQIKTSACCKVPMSKWRVKGFVQDSDEEEEEIELSSSSPTRDSQHSVRSNPAAEKDDLGHEYTNKVEPTNAIAQEPDARKDPLNPGNSGDQQLSKDAAASPCPRLHNNSHLVCDEPSTVIQTVEEIPRTQIVTPPAIVSAVFDLREQTESPDPLAGSPTPKAKRVDNPDRSSQILGALSISQKPASPAGGKDEGVGVEISLPTDQSDSELSDPPSGLDELQPEEVVFDPPTRKTTVQVVIPRSTTIQQSQPEPFERFVQRSLRERKPIQLHPYLLEGEIYRRDLQGRGVKPVIRVCSPPRKARHHDQESQEQEFDPDNDAAPSSPLEMPVSAPLVRQGGGSSHGSPVRRKQNHSQKLTSTAPAHNGTKRRKLDHLVLSSSTSRQTLVPENGPVNAEMWAVPQSPPYSSSPVNRPGSVARQMIRMPTKTPVPDLPTPSKSSSVPPPLDLESDDEPVVRSVQRAGQRAHQPIILSDSSSSDTEPSEGEAQPDDHELRQVGRKIKGVLPASWLRLDRQAQERRNRQMRDRLNSLHSPGKAEPQRGVALKFVRRRDMPSRPQRPILSSDRAVSISDESDVDVNVPVPRVDNAQESARAAFEAAAMLDHRYADEDSDTMENNRLQLFTLGGSRKKRKVQSKLTDVFATTKRRKFPSKSKDSSKAHSSKRHTDSRKTRHTPSPALGILDFDQSPPDNQAVPQFLRIARRQARQRPDNARQSPTNKYIRLQTAQDTEDANITLRQWRAGGIKLRTNVGQTTAGPAPRLPLIDLDQNRQRPLGDAASVSSTGQRHQPVTQKSRPAGLYTRQGQLPHSRQMNGHHDSSESRSRMVQVRKQNTVPFRNAQLEGLAADYGGIDRRDAFQKGLQRVNQQFDLQQPIFQPSRNLQIARFLADDDVKVPPLRSAEVVDEQTHESPSRKTILPKRRLKRKPQAKRVDVETREYRQPSEPVVDEYLKAVPNLPIPDLGQGRTSVLILQGLGAYGTRYSTTFDVSPLQDGTYFHVSTFIGSGGLHRALAIAGPNPRNLDEAVGYCTIDLAGTSIGCGPWEDSVYARLADSMTTLWDAAAGPIEGDEQRSLLENPVEKVTQVLRSLVDYVSTHLSFHDPIDRRSFVGKMEQWITSSFESVMSSNIAYTESASAEKAKPLALLLVLCVQIRSIAQHPTVEPSASGTLGMLITSISKSLVGEILDHVSGLSGFLENNKRFQIRENGIRDSDGLVESLVVCLHVLPVANVPRTTFWELVGQSLSSTAKRASHLAEFEAVWATIFTLLPFVEFNDLGIPIRSRRASFKEDDWTVIRTLVQRLFALYPGTLKENSASLNDYVRAVLTRCHSLIHYWNWKRCESVLYAMFDFFVAKNGLLHLSREQCIGSAGFLEQIDDRLFSRLEPNESSFHIFLKCLFIGIQGMRARYEEKKLRSVILRLIPNHGRLYPKDQPLELQSLEALRNHHDMMCTLYRACPPPCRPRLGQITSLVSHETSHREACRIGIRAWTNLTMFQLSTDEPYDHAQPFAVWQKGIMTQTLKQYRVAKTEAEECVKSGVLADSEASSLMARQFMEKNQDQVITALRDTIGGMLKSFGVRKSQVMLKEFLVDSNLVHLLELPHLQDHRLVIVIRDALGVLRAFAKLPRQLPTETDITEQSEESQDYGDAFELEDLMEIDQVAPQPDGTLQTPLWRLLSNAFGAETPPDDSLLMDCVETWCLIARSQVSSGARSWTFYLDPFGQVSWQQLRRTEQSQKFAPYFMASVLECDPLAYPQHRITFLNALLVSLADRESLLRFQHRLLSAITRASPNEPLLQNLPFVAEAGTGSRDITEETVRTRRLALISMILSNIRDDFHNTIHEEPARVVEVKGTYGAMLKDFMGAMKSNYQQLGSGVTVAGAYVEFVQKVVQFLQQYTADIHPVLDFFTNSVAFPLPATDPAYVVGRLCGYAPKLFRPGVAKQLSVFVQTVAQQAATGSHQPYLVHQLQTALCTDEAPPKDRIALRNVLLQGIFPAYVEAAFTSCIGFVIAQPILESLAPILQSLLFDVRVFDQQNVQAVCGCLLAISHAFIRGTEQVKENARLLSEPHILHALTLMFDIAIPISSVLDYICGRCTTASTKSLLTTHFEQLALFVRETLHDIPPQVIPFYDVAAHGAQMGNRNAELLAFSVKSLKSDMDINWSASGDGVYFAHGHARREVVVDWDVGEVESEKLVGGIEAFLAHAAALGKDEGDGEMDGRVDYDFVGDVDV
ncbi:hypothetical protein BU23DRAFT_596197 [Bimuria novae-zelandiae CBS 107.79]|uniref:Protein geranylgeranyltransferase type II n=1 Tax=Bimuria novae-zelandiae CBS 107.79 TaxID=1447943 RepID=A0A6A5VJR3_9PLEO|nr:hypothetical protein BU23DRAFT_596197 [Bimuria novae-zelandiae CBS 107.79]